MNRFRLLLNGLKSGFANSLIHYFASVSEMKWTIHINKENISQIH